MKSLSDLLSQRGIILLDGAMGTELGRRGVDISLPLWSAAALETAPETVFQIHADYVVSGARIITANTFRTTSYTYQRAGLDEHSAREAARQATHSAIGLARQAAQGRALVAGSLAPVNDCYAPRDYPGPEIAQRTYRELAGWITERGADMLLLETHITLEEARIALQEAIATGLPVCISFLIDADMNLLDGTPLAEAVRAAEEEGSIAILLNCITLPVATKGIETLAGLTRLPVGVYANAGRSRPSKEGTIAEYVSDAEYAAAAQGWANRGAGIIGGCCGTTPRTIAALQQHIHPLADTSAR